jgi:hypothetical protein
MYLAAHSQCGSAAHIACFKSLAMRVRKCSIKAWPHHFNTNHRVSAICSWQQCAMMIWGLPQQYRMPGVSTSSVTALGIADCTSTWLLKMQSCCTWQDKPGALRQLPPACLVLLLC